MHKIFRVWGPLALLCLATPSAHAFLDFHDVAVRGLLERFLQTEAGGAFARSVLGPHVTRFNPSGRQEVINTLMHPRNAPLAEVFERRLLELNRAIEARTEGALADAPAELVARESERIFGLSPARRAGELVFADGEAVALMTAREARNAEFFMGGEVAPVRIPKQSTLPAPPVGFQHNAFEQLLQWEELAGLRQYRETAQFFGLPMSSVPMAEVDLMTSRDLPGPIAALFVRGDRVFWPRHPFNTYEQVPFSGHETVETWPARLTSSRSMVIWNKATGQAFSLKAPTNYPHRTEPQLGKVNLQDDIRAGVYRSDYLAAMDRRLGYDRDLRVLPEIFSAASKRGGNGFVVRDLTALQDGHYYLPALSLPFVGPRIAQLNGASFAAFWEKNYAQLLGRSKAKLLVRYGLQMETPNCQNMLIQLDRKLRPTGKLFFRDISDSQPVRQVAEAIGQEAMLARDKALGFKIDQALNPMTENSFWRLDEDPLHGIDRATLERWMAAHDEAYVREAMRLLGATEAQVGPPTGGNLQRYLFSPSGQAALARFHRLK